MDFRWRLAGIATVLLLAGGCDHRTRVTVEHEVDYGHHHSYCRYPHEQHSVCIVEARVYHPSPVRRVYVVDHNGPKGVVIEKDVVIKKDVVIEKRPDHERTGRSYRR